ncbi:MAG: DUF928 domain-containing protein [Nitrospiraceae bacterium]
MLTPLVSLLVTISLGAPGSGFEPAAFAGSSSLRAPTRLTAADPTAPRYKPRSSKAPRARIEGGTRGQDGTTPNVIPLVPDHIGLTIATQPVLYWYVSRPTTSTVMFVLLDARSVEVLNKVALTPPFQTGVHVLRLKDYGITLEKDLQYRWYIAIVLDPQSPSRDIVAGGMIERIAPDVGPPHPPSTNNLDAVRFYAEAGLWYDAIAAISDLISEAPNDPLLRKQRASLLTQVGLQEVAEWELRQAGKP